MENLDREASDSESMRLILSARQAIMDLSRPGDGLRSMSPGEESPDFTERNALGNQGRGDPTESAAETKPPAGPAKVSGQG